ncbi:MAG TPA: 16S rRNA (cytosine(967)-C(5))-methyltransferase RsmB, partial [Pyrinomonadaceae bacterium]|nr:16S rRNA (cytosine(967)-C(5))-methyltransferase RsmB [Pyrinomonadaceae bacterium]
MSRPERARTKHDQPGPISPARLAAFNILRRVEEGGYASILLASRAERLKPADRALCHELVLGVLRRQLWLDRLIEYYSDRSLTSLDTDVVIALRLGLYQLRFLSRIPAPAAVNESVKLVRRAGLRSAEGFVNAVLRRAIREPDVNPAAAISNPLARLAVETSHPKWVLTRWINAFGTSEAEALARANNQPAPVAFRIVRNKARESEIIDQLRAKGAEVIASQIARGAWRITNGGSLLHELAQSGQIYIQDEASQLVGQIVDAQPGDRVLDLCAAPGGKTTQIASQSNAIQVIAGDVHEHRVRTVANVARLQSLSNIQSVVLNAEESPPFAPGSFDRVLVDAPCSGTGTLRHNPEIRWRISAAGIRDLANRQKQILLNAAGMVKTGGRLVYSTCSVDPEENEAVVSAFLNETDSFAPLDLKDNPSLVTAGGHLRTWPHRDDVDGFFI